MKVKSIRYGRSVEIESFKRKAWFGWDAELDEGETEEEAMKELHDLADEREKAERKIPPQIDFKKPEFPYPGEDAELQEKLRRRM